jgi:hypothetical protein
MDDWPTLAMIRIGVGRIRIEQAMSTAAVSISLIALMV